ncbi:MAG: Ig-like domain-containing protein [Clostridia bacterium]|nr:Ig-like domain-containing protein [Clostridia bacterium]
MALTFKKILCSLLVVVMCMISTLLSGFIGIDLPGIKWFSGGISVVHATSISLPSQITIFVGEVTSLNPTFSSTDTSNKEFTVTGTDHTYSYKSGAIFQQTKTDTCKISDYISIGPNGMIKGLKATIEPQTKKTFAFTLTVRFMASGETAEVRVTVMKKMLSLTYMGDDSPWYYGNSAKLTATLDDSITSKYSNSDICFESSDTSIATASSDGTVTVKGKGTVTITAYTYDYVYSGSFQIYCRSVINVEKDYFENCKVDTPYQINATLQPGGDGETVRFASTDTSIATVDSNGNVKMLKNGSAKIIVMTNIDSVNYKEIWFTTDSFTSPSTSKLQLFNLIKEMADSIKTSDILPGFVRNDASYFTNISLVNKGSYDDVLNEDDLYVMFSDLATPKTFNQKAVTLDSTEDLENYMANVPVKGQYTTIVEGLSMSDIESIVFIDKGSYTYDLKLTLEEESFTYLPTSGLNTRHGKVFDILTSSYISNVLNVINNSSDDMKITYDLFAQRYYDSSITVSVNKVTGKVTDMKYDMNIDVNISNLKFAYSFFTYTADVGFSCNNIVNFDFLSCDNKNCEFGHTFINYISDGKANCTTDGFMIAKCYYCDAIDSIPEKGGHSFSDKWTIDIEPTCTSIGSKSRHCFYCDEKVDITSMDKLSHTYDTVVILPSCTNQGYTTYTCKCGDSYIGNYVDMLMHTYAPIVISPTCTQNGYTLYTCACGDNYTETISATGHNFINGWSTLLAPTCKERGVKIKVCDTCHYIESEELPKIMHTDADGDFECDMCSMKLVSVGPDIPSDPSENCDCNCHAGGIKAFFFRLVNFFQKLFGKNKVCECGVAH